MLAIAILVALAQATTVFPNSTTLQTTSTANGPFAAATTDGTPTSLTDQEISAINGAALQAPIVELFTSSLPPVPFLPCYTNGQYCWRAGAPFYDWSAEGYNCPFAYGRSGWFLPASGEAQCFSIWTSSLSSWFSTAPITFSGPLIPASTTRPSWAPLWTTYTEIEHFNAYYTSQFTSTPAEPCCSSCVAYGGTVQIYQ